VDPGRNILSYSLLNGGPNSEVDFLNLIHAQEKGNWNTAYLASAINDYIRAGYHMARYWAQLNGNVVERVIVCDDAAWIDTRLGGTWVETFIGNTVKQYAGIGFGCDNHSQYIFAQQWVQPLGSEDAYQPGSYVFHNSAIWQCRVSNCVWEPGVFGWFDPISEVPKWIQPIGAGSEYAINVEVMHGGKQWKCNTPANVWEPGVFGWDDITHIETPEPEYPAWAPWPGSGPLYQGGDRVTHNGLIWEATVGNNVWEPGVFGWIEVTP